MRLNTLFPVLLIILTTLYSCQQSPPVRNAGQKPTVQVFGNPACPHCRQFITQLKSAGIAYQFLDISENENHKATMWALLKKHHPDAKRVGLPIVQFNQKVYLRPDFNNFKKIYASNP